MTEQKKSCKNCFYNFDGVCANHCFLNDNNIDPYGMKIEEIEKKYICNGYRLKPSFLKEQNKTVTITITGELLKNIEKQANKLDKPITATVKYMIHNVLIKDI